MHWGVSRGSDWQYIETELVFPQNEWVHVTTVVDETDTGYFYWNGNLVASGPMHTPMQTLRNLQYIARPAIDWWQYFNGVIDEFVVYTHALSQEEVMELVAGELDSDVPWLSIDPISGTVPANDSINVQVTFDTTDLLPDIYTTTLFLSSNDPLIPLAEIPITMTVTGEVTPTSVIIDGVDQGWLGREYAFTATVSPETAGTPITYTWQADGQVPGYPHWRDHGYHLLYLGLTGHKDHHPDSLQCIRGGNG